MLTVFTKLKNKLRPYFNKTVLKPIGQVFGFDILGKFIGFAVSILLVRELGKSDYAIYTILITIQGMLIPLSNSAIFIGFKKIGGEVWNDSKKMRSLLRTSHSLVSYLIVLAFLFVSAYAYFILEKIGVSPMKISWYLICLLLLVIPEVKSSFIRSAFLLRKHIITVKISELIGHLVRSIGILIVVFLIPKSFVLSLIYLSVVLSFWVTYGYLLRKTEKYKLNSKKASIDIGYKKTLLKYIRLNWHNSIFFAFKSQVSVFILGIFGTTAALANIGALSRFSLVFAIITSVFNSIYAPAFSRCQEKNRLIKMFISSILTAIVISLMVLLIIYFFPNFFLWLLGADYKDLSNELFLVFAGGSLSFLLSIIYSINISKAWIRFTPILEIPIDIMGLIVGLFLFDVTTLTGVLYLVIFSTLLNILLHFSNSIYGLINYVEE